MLDRLALVHDDLPRKRRLVEDHPEAGAPDQTVNEFGRMDECAEGAPTELIAQVLKEKREPGQPRVSRIDEAVESARVGGREADEGGCIVIAADDTIEGDHVGFGHAGGEGDEVAVEVGYAIGEAGAGSLLPGDLDISRGSLDARGFAGARGEKLQLHRADAAADVKQREAFDANIAEGANQQGRRLHRPALAVEVKVLERPLPGFQLQALALTRIQVALLRVRTFVQAPPSNSPRHSRARTAKG